MVQATSKRERRSFQIKGLTGLSHSATRFLDQYPNRAKLAVQVALEAAASQHDVPPAIEDVPDALKPFVVPQLHEDEMLGVSDAASRLKISRTTVYDWVEKDVLLAWKATKRGLTIPAEQILGAGRVVEGLDRVLDTIGDPELAWEFLSTEIAFADDVVRPIDALKDGRIEDVIGAATAYGTATT